MSRLVVIPEHQPRRPSCEVPKSMAIRFFQKPDCWVGGFSAEPIARSFPSFEELSAEARRGQA